MGSARLKASAARLPAPCIRDTTYAARAYKIIQAFELPHTFPSRRTSDRARKLAHTPSGRAKHEICDFRRRTVL